MSSLLSNGKSEQILQADSMYLKAKTRYYYTPVRIANIPTLTIPNAGQDMEQQEISFIADGNAKW